jgi:CheY-like chemotaxis protein
LARTVLLADDSVTAQNMGRRILMDAGYEVITVNNGSAALKKIHENPPDLIVLDVYMPGYGGLEVCQRLKESGETMRIPVLLTVGKMEPFKTDEAKRVRADAHIVKPFEAGELLAALTKLEDRIIPQSETRKRGKAAEGKKARVWHVDEPNSAQAQADWSEKIAYLAEVKRRREESEASAEPSPQPLPSTEIKPVMPEENAEVAEASPAANVAVAEATVPEIEVTPPQVEEPVEAVTFASGSETEPAREYETPTEPAPEFAVQSAPSENADEVPVAASEIETVVETAAEAEVAASITPASIEGDTCWVAENVPVSTEEASLELDKEMQQAQAVGAANLGGESSETHSNQSREQVSVAAEERVSSPPDEATSGVAFAAAASASDGVSALSAEASAIAGDTAEAVPSEAAAAWQNWQQIRESVMSPQSASALAESVAEIAQSSLSAPTSSEPAQIDSSPDGSDRSESVQSSALDSIALASIVDNVLAELKPRLMEEIAKKLAKDKK